MPALAWHHDDGDCVWYHGHFSQIRLGLMAEGIGRDPPGSSADFFLG